MLTAIVVILSLERIMKGLVDKNIDENRRITFTSIVQKKFLSSTTIQSNQDMIVFLSLFIFDSTYSFRQNSFFVVNEYRNDHYL